MGATEDDIEELVTETKKILQSHYKDRREEALRSALPRHAVRITEPFLMSAHEITIDQFCQVTGSDQETAALWLARVDEDRRADPNIGLHPAHTKWIDAIHFCNKLSTVEGLPEYYAIEEESVTPLHNEGFRLPTEAEWEFASRSGSCARIWMDGVHTKISDYAFYRDPSSRTMVECREVGQKLPNAFGLYDMFGNMGEWCFDFYGAKYYTNSTQTDPNGPESGALHVRRGSGHDSYVFNIAAWIRSFGQSEKSAGAIRVVRNPKRPAQQKSE